MRIEKGKGSRTLIFCRELSPETITKNMVIISKYEGFLPVIGHPVLFQFPFRQSKAAPHRFQISMPVKAKGSCPLRFVKIEFGDSPYQEIASKEKLLEVLSYLLRTCPS